MKRIIIYISAVVILAGCSKKLDVKPLQSINENEVFTSDVRIKAALNGAYDIVSGASVLGGDMQLYSELLGANSEISWVGTFNEPDEIFSKSILTNNSYVRDTYLEAYRAINICNNILAQINVANEEDRDRIKGEALLLRGLMYFELVKLYAKPYSAGNTTVNLGMQLLTSPTTNGQIVDANYVPRSTVEQTYTQILSDLTSAKTLMDDTYGIYAGSYTASAVLSRVYLQMGNYDGARDEANNVIENSGAELEDEYSKAFNNVDPSKEDIYVLPVTAQDGSNDMHTFWSILQYGARDGDVEVNQEHMDLYEDGDARKALFYIDENDIYRTGKWKFQYRFMPLIRLAEMYLTRAEANFRLGTAIGNSPDADLNAVIRTRAGLASVDVNLDNILYERRLELAHEGQRIHDIKRLQEPVDGFDYNANELVFPIPLREIDASNGKLIQNDGY